MKIRRAKRINAFMRERMRSLRTILIVSMSGFALIALIVSAFVLNSRFSDSLTNTAMTNSTQVVNHVANTFNTYISGMIDVSDRIITQSERTADLSAAQAMLDTACNLRGDIATIAVLDAAGNIKMIAPSTDALKKNLSIRNQQWFTGALDSGGQLSFSPPHVQDFFDLQYAWVVTLSRVIDTDQSVFGKNSILSIDMNFKSIGDYCNSVTIGQRGYVFILDGNNNIIYHPQQQLINAGIKKEDTAFIAGKPDGAYLHQGNVIVISSLKDCPWKIVGISFLDELQARRQEAVDFILLLLAFGVAVFSAVSVLVSRRISGPIMRLTKTMENVDRGSLDVACPEGKGFLELDVLAHTFNNMIVRIKDLMEQVKREEHELRKTELKALQAQINPHFLYNTLDSILWMCEKNDGPGAVKMVSALASLFRISISRGKEIITLREELIHAESYLLIQSMRYRDQFDYTIDADEDILDCMCLKIIIQPMLENAIYHGINRMVTKGSIIVRVRGMGDKIHIQVSDNGLGIPKDVLDNILNTETANAYGIGVKNVNDRIRIYFGAEYELKIESELDHGTTVNIWLPKLREEGK
jgi:two-component system sensor histidine kinase YesM